MESVSLEEVAAAEAYEALHVPALFKQWAPHVVAAAGVQRGQRVLDVATGTGVLAREVSTSVGPDGAVVGLDAGPGMLAVAQRLAPEIKWQRGLAEDLPFDDGAFDAVVSQFGLMFFGNRLRAVSEMERVLVPGGRIAVAVWESLDKSEAYPDEVALLAKEVGSQAADALRAPFVLGDRAGLRELFESAGLRDVEVETLPGTAMFPSIRAMVEADLRGWLPVMRVVLTEEQIQRVLTGAEEALARYVTPQGTVEFSAPAHVVTATKSVA